jgi:predicted transcriptional regulator
MNDKLAKATSEIISVYVANNSVASSALGDLIANVHKALVHIEMGSPAVSPVAPPTPAVPIKKSITPEFLICLEDGKKFKSLKRHLRSAYQMTPEEYRVRWDLPEDYPMLAPNYARQRSDIAKQIGLGKNGRLSQRKNA